MTLLTADEVAAQLRLSPWTIRRDCSTRKIPFLKIGSRVMFQAEEVEKWVQKRAVKPVGA